MANQGRNSHNQSEFGGNQCLGNTGGKGDFASPVPKMVINLKVVIIPVTVPNSPSKGAVPAVTAIKVRKRSSFRLGGDQLLVENFLHLILVPVGIFHRSGQQPAHRTPNLLGIFEGPIPVALIQGLDNIAEVLGPRLANPGNFYEFEDGDQQCDTGQPQDEVNDFSPFWITSRTVSLAAAT